MKILIALTKVAVFFLYTSLASAEVIFEGYYKLTLAQQHIGYFIQRYDLDANSKTFSSTSYLFTKSEGITTTESLSAKSTSKLEPLSYQYSRLEGTKSKAVDAVVKKDGKKNKLVIKVIENGKAQAREFPLNDKIFFSTFLAYLMLQNPKGIQVGNKFSYETIAEEDGQIERGEVFIKEQAKEKGLDAFRTLNTFKKDEFVSWMNTKGEVIKISVPKAQYDAELMANPKEAYADMPLSESSVRLLFGNIPEGKANLLNKK